ncbi:shikimate dehydrogenase [Acidihalobacter ferrooxydans]|uniref:Shikimate dehydrogenase (NADP(+)) n=1 Tax=Acidihalobacter ferrooxydans TaxID=1765967 RepID=A0A1P8UKL4_9GAMM|nr:shikimate dehydrogenase [Acidihalobacter ferrooxydans]APZ44359.1 shikimate dehydrogenase [Acidihalobacter ferrooxydans]
MTDRYAVMGNPIGHSRSPAIHARFAAQTGQAIDYAAILAPVAGFAAAVAAFREQGGRGLNVTVPFKQEACALADELTPRARRAGAVNTLRFAPGEPVFGDTTDGVGLLHDLQRNLGLTLAGRRILLLGAGGAARGVIEPLLEAAPAELVIANRTAARAEQLARLFADLGPLRATALDALDGAAAFDILINATSASLAGTTLALPAHLVAADSVAYDMVYAARPTPFMRWAGEHGAARVADGLGMLVEQAAESFFLWRGVRPRTAPVIADLRAQLAASYA